MSTNTQHAAVAPAHHPICDRKRFNPLCQGCEAERAASQATAAAPVESATGAELLIGVAVGMEHEGATVVIQQQMAGGRVAVIYTGTHGKGESTGRAALLTTTEGGELLTPKQRLNIADAVRNAFPLVHVPHNVYDQIAWNTEQACYVAALELHTHGTALQRTYMGTTADGTPTIETETLAGAVWKAPASPSQADPRQATPPGRWSEEVPTEAGHYWYWDGRQESRPVLMAGMYDHWLQQLVGAGGEPLAMLRGYWWRVYQPPVSSVLTPEYKAAQSATNSSATASLAKVADTRGVEEDRQ